jgi:hypothetical protein
VCCEGGGGDWGWRGSEGEGESGEECIIMVKGRVIFIRRRLLLLLLLLLRTSLRFEDLSMRRNRIGDLRRD